MVVHNKLVRNNIPRIIAATGKKAAIHSADPSEFRAEIYRKLLEEAQELNQDRNIEEAADLQEILLALYTLEGWDMQEVERIRLKKREERGTFDHRIILEMVSD
jgi:predicted house-cleaning noncanonical NTP pyrophosphatase (MazG superfamily)